MKIHSIANSPYFGYNKELNEKVNNKLKRSKGNRELADTMLALNNYCMETEDKLRRAEAENNKQLVDRYDYLLSGIKIVATNQINARFPELNYRRTELETYGKEIEDRKISNPEHWLAQLFYTLEQVDENEAIMTDILNRVKQGKKEGKSDEEITEAIKDTLSKKYNMVVIGSDEEQALANDPSSAPKPEAAKKTKKSKKIDKGARELVELFVPGEFSAKGFVNIGGMDELKDKISDKIIIPLRDPEIAKLDEVEYGKKFPRGELLYGPPGCGKTYFAEALSQEAGLPMYKLKISKVGSQYINGSACNLEEAYNYIKQQAKDTGKPVIMFIDEMEAFTAKRDESGKHAEDNKLLGAFLQIMDDARSNNVFVVGATNLINLIDPAVANRFDSKDYIEIPKDDTRRVVLAMMLKRFTKGLPLANNPEELEKVVKRTAGFSNRTLGVLVNEAADIARKDGRRPLMAEDFKQPIQKHAADRLTNESIYMDKQCTPKIGFAKN